MCECHHSCRTAPTTTSVWVSRICNPTPPSRSSSLCSARAASRSAGRHHQNAAVANQDPEGPVERQRGGAGRWCGHPRRRRQWRGAPTVRCLPWGRGGGCGVVLSRWVGGLVGWRGRGGAALGTWTWERDVRMPKCVHTHVCVRMPICVCAYQCVRARVPVCVWQARCVGRRLERSGRARGVRWKTSKRLRSCGF